MKKIYRKHKTIYDWGKRYLSHPDIIETKRITEIETLKRPLRSDIINYLIWSLKKSDIVYLEIGVRNPKDNFDLIKTEKKYSVDPGIEFKENPVSYKLTSDDFFSQLKSDKILDSKIKFDVIFIDGLHLADQVKRDINNAIEFLSDDGFIVLHDCNPPTEWHARYNYRFDISPASIYWNGTTWKAFVEFRKRVDFFSCCIDSDWGVGLISKKINFGLPNKIENIYFEYNIFNEWRKESLNLISFEEFKCLVR